MLFLPLAEASSDSFFTTVAYDGKNSLFLGWKSAKNSNAKILEYKLDDSSSKQISLPEALLKKDIIGIIPDTESMAVLTHTIDDKTPTVHLFKRRTDTWTEKGKAPCLSFAKITLKKNRLIFHCEKLNRRGKTKINRQTLDLGRDRIHLSGFVRIPDMWIRYKGLQVVLEGKAPHWNKMRIRKDENEKFVDAGEFEE